MLCEVIPLYCLVQHGAGAAPFSAGASLTLLPDTALRYARAENTVSTPVALRHSLHIPRSAGAASGRCPPWRRPFPSLMGAAEDSTARRHRRRVQLRLCPERSETRLCTIPTCSQSSALGGRIPRARASELRTILSFVQAYMFVLETGHLVDFGPAHPNVDIPPVLSP